MIGQMGRMMRREFREYIIISTGDNGLSQPRGL